MTNDKIQRSTYTTDELEKIALKLKKLPEIEKSKQKHSKQEAINYLKKEIISLQKRGYSLINIADTLKGVGIDISTPTLRNYLTRAKNAENAITENKEKTKKHRKPQVTNTQDTPAASQPILPETSKDSSGSKGTFSVRSDRKDI